MAPRQHRSWVRLRALLVVTGTLFLTCSLVLIYQAPFTEKCDCVNGNSPHDKVDHYGNPRAQEKATNISGGHQMAILVPFRDRFEELLHFVPYMHKFLNKQDIKHKFYIIHQIDQYRFNRASLINIGYKLSRTECDYTCMHDVDLLPNNSLLSYAYPADGPFHIASPALHPKYHYKTFVGGILMLNNEHFEKTNGMSNLFWGWGREDDSFYIRMHRAGLNISRPQLGYGGITTRNKTFIHVHNRRIRPRDQYRYGGQKEAQKKLLYEEDTGLKTLKYDLVRKRELRIEGVAASLYDVELDCDLDVTPWCVTPEQLQRMIDDVQNFKGKRIRKPLAERDVNFS